MVVNNEWLVLQLVPTMTMISTLAFVASVYRTTKAVDLKALGM